MTTTIKRQILEALVDGDRLEDLVCAYNPMAGDSRTYDGEYVGYAGVRPAPIRCRGDELPERPFFAGYGRVEGEPTICYSARYVYVRVTYDGSECFEAVPRHPEFVGQNVPIYGGG